MDIGELESKKITELREMAKEMEIPGFSTMKKKASFTKYCGPMLRRKAMIFVVVC